MSNYSILFGFEKWVLQNLGFLVKTLCSSQLNDNVEKLNKLFVH